jgi:tetratricopeptide (TPR) repeat protein
VIEMSPENSHAWNGKGDCYRGLKDYQTAIEAWQRAIKFGMDPKYGLTRIGDAYVNLEKFEEAEETYNKAITFGYSKYACLGLIRIYMKRNQFENVRETFNILNQKDSDDPRVKEEYNKFIKREKE